MCPIPDKSQSKEFNQVRMTSAFGPQPLTIFSITCSLWQHPAYIKQAASALHGPHVGSAACLINLNTWMNGKLRLLGVHGLLTCFIFHVQRVTDWFKELKDKHQLESIGSMTASQVCVHVSVCVQVCASVHAFMLRVSYAQAGEVAKRELENKQLQIIEQKDLKRQHAPLSRCA